jgi:hypothetical protein
VAGELAPPVVVEPRGTGGAAGLFDIIDHDLT